METHAIAQLLIRQLTDMISQGKKECEYIYDENEHDYYAKNIKDILIQANTCFPEYISLFHFPSSGQKGKIKFVYYYDASTRANAIKCIFDL